MPERVDILGIGFDTYTLSGAIDRACALAASEGNHMVVTPNSEIAYMAKNDDSLKEIINSADLVVPDGIGVIKAAKMLGTPIPEKVAGIELGEGIAARLSENGGSLFLLGAKPGVAEAAAEKLCAKYPGLNIAGVHDGYFSEDAQVIDAVNASGADVLFVCLGAPKQELWMAKNRDALNTHLMLGIGGSLDVFAGVVKRAPDIFIKLGLEWFYRLLKQPTRIGRMMALPKFILAVRRYARGNKHAG